MSSKLWKSFTFPIFDLKHFFEAFLILKTISIFSIQNFCRPLQGPVTIIAKLMINASTELCQLTEKLANIISVFN